MDQPSIIVAAKEFAHAAHDAIQQKRKYTDEPYWVHTDDVAQIVASVTDDPAVIAAAHLHDVLEDVWPLDSRYSPGAIATQFGIRVAALVDDLTDVYTREAFPTWNRARRKEYEARRLAQMSAEAQTIKLADLISNSRDIVKHDPGFAKVYLAEKAVLLRNLLKGSPVLWEQANGCIPA